VASLVEMGFSEVNILFLIIYLIAISILSSRKKLVQHYPQYIGTPVMLLKAYAKAEQF
jgi:hypothetical protein